MKNHLTDLNNYLFEQLERLNDDSLTDEQLDGQIRKASAMTKIADVIIRNGELVLKAMEYSAEYEIGENEGAVRMLLPDAGGGKPKGGKP